MDMDALSIVKHGDEESLGIFMFENSLQHGLFRDTFMDKGILVPSFPLMDVNVSNFDDWLMAHQVEHQSFAALLDLNNPFNMLDVDFGKENEFYDWIASHLYIHEQIAASLGLT